MKRKFAISDIHGCLRSFRALVQQLELTPADELYLLGDFTDRGPHSKGVIDYIWQLQDEGYQVYCLQGNHDVMIGRATQRALANADWLRHGGMATLKSFGVDRAEEIPGDYLLFLSHLPKYYIVDQYILVHAGLNFRVMNPLSDEENMLWIRRWYDDIDYNWLGERYIIHGHTPIRRRDMEAMHAKLDQRRVLDIDGGCFFDVAGMGFLVAFELGTHRLYWQPSLDGNRSNPRL